MNAPIRSRPILLLLLACAALGAAAHPAPAVESSPPIVFVVFDELPTVSLLDAEGGVDATLYPHFAELAATSTWARGASTVATRLLESVPVLLTGRMPSAERTLSIQAEYPDNLFTWLEGEYALNVREQQSLLGPTRLDAEGQARWLTEVRNDRYKGMEQGQVFERFLRVIERRAKGGGDAAKPTLDFVHLMLPYAPWRHSASGRLYEPRRVDGNIGGTWAEDSAFAEDGWRRHLLEVRYTDALLGRLIASLKKAGHWEQSLVVVTSTYGAGFWPGESRRTPSRTAHPEDVLLVPLFVKAPGQKQGAVVDAVVQSIDVLPTIVAAMGREPPWPMDGCSILDASCERPAQRKAMRLDGSAESRSIDAYPRDLHRRGATLERKLALFPDADHLERSWPAGRFSSWLGEPVDEKAVVAGDVAPGTWSIDRGARDWGRGKKGGPRFTGFVELAGVAAEAEPPRVAIALNGRLEAIVHPVPARGGRLALRAILPESRLERGANALALYVVREGEGSVKLEPLEQRVAGGKRQKKRKAQ